MDLKNGNLAYLLTVLFVVLFVVFAFINVMASAVMLILGFMILIFGVFVCESNDTLD